MKRALKKRPSAAALAKRAKTKLAKRGIRVYASGRAVKNGVSLSAKQIRRAVAAVKAAVVAPKKKVVTRARVPAKAKKKPAPARPVRAISKRRVEPKPVVRAKAKPIAKKTSARARAAKERARQEQIAQAKRAAARHKRELARRRELEEKLVAQEKRAQKLAREQRAMRKETAKLREQIAKIEARPAPAPPPSPPPRELPAREREEEEEVAPPPPPRPAPPPKPLTDLERLEAEEAAEAAARAKAKAPPAQTPFDVMIRDAVARAAKGEELTPEDFHALQIAALAFAPAPPQEEATDADYAMAAAYANLEQPDQRAWAKATDAQGLPRLSEAAKRLIREHAIEQAIEHRSIKTLIDARKSPIFSDDAQIRRMMRTLGPLEDRVSISFDEARALIVDYLRTKDKFQAYRDDINKFLLSVKPASDQIEAAIAGKDARERQKILEDLIPELAKRFPQLTLRELWAMAKSPQSVSVVI